MSDQINIGNKDCFKSNPKWLKTKHSKYFVFSTFNVQCSDQQFVQVSNNKSTASVNILVAAPKCAKQQVCYQGDKKCIQKKVVFIFLNSALIK